MLNWIISSSVLVLVMIILRTIFKGKIDPRIQYALWGIVLIRLLFPFNFISSDFSVSLNDIDSEVIEEAEIPIFRKVYVNGENEAEFQKAYSEFYNVDISEVPKQNELIKPILYFQKKIDIKTLLDIIVFSGAALTFIVFAISNLQFCLKLRRMRKIFRDGRPKVYTVAVISSPCLFGNSIYMKKSDSENERKTECIIAHEMTHYRHLDNVWSLLRVFAVCLHWYNPLVWIAAMLSKRDSELACDVGTIKKLGEARRIEYGETLLGMLCTKNPAKNIFSVATTMDSGKRSIKERVKMIAKNPKLISVSLAIVMLAVLVTSCGTFSNPHGKLNENQYQSLVDEFEAFTASPNHIDPVYKKYADVKRFCALDILGIREKDGKTEIYTYAYDACYSYFKGKVYDGGGSGFSDICMIAAEINGDSVKIADIWYPQDGAGYWKSIREKVPAGIQLKIKIYDRDKIHRRAEAQASQYFNAPFGEAMLNIYFDEDKGQDVYQIIDDSFVTTDSGTFDENFVEEFEILEDYHADPTSFSACAIEMQGYCENAGLWNDFYEQVQKRVNCNIIISMKTSEGDPIYIYLEYEDGVFTVFEDDSHDRFSEQAYYTREYGYLIREENEHETVYLLTTSPEYTYEKHMKRVLSSQMVETSEQAEVIMRVK